MQIEASRRELKGLWARFAISLLTVAVLAGLLMVHARAATFTVDLGSGTAEQNGLLDIFILFGILAILPSLIMMMTSFTRIIIVLSFLRNALGTQQSPPNQVLIGIALFLTLFIMSPVIREVDEQAYRPYRDGAITQQEALDRAQVPVKQFMLRQTKEKELSFFLSVSGEGAALAQAQGDHMEALTGLGLEVIVPAFITSELKRAFTMGFYLYVPFLIIDLVVSSTLMSMGMVMLPPSMISLPFKIMMFVLVDGWNLLFETLINSFR